MNKLALQPVNSNNRFTQDDDKQWWYLISRPSSNRTRAIIKNCLHCGNPYLTIPSRIRGNRAGRCGLFCSRLCGTRASGGHRGRKAELSHLWKGGRKSTGKSGYIELFCPDHPSLVGTKRKYVREHRLVMETKLGRLLENWEEVHHINGVRDDNRIENLELWVKSHPAGARFQEAIQHCPSCTCNKGILNLG